jgi:hypothetical protein
MKVVFVGNCQMRTIFQVYRRALPEMRAGAHFVRGWLRQTDTDQIALASADRIVFQVSQKKLPPMPIGARRYPVPMVGAPFLWPSSGEERPDNPRREWLPQGPYPAAVGNGIMNHMIRSGTHPDEAEHAWFAAISPDGAAWSACARSHSTSSGSGTPCAVATDAPI